MPRKITNPLRQGLPSKIYLIAYGRNYSGYEIAKKVYEVKKGNPNTSKIYPWINKMKSEGLLEDFHGKNRSSSNPFFNEIINSLKAEGIELTDSEKTILLKIVESIEFREYVSENTDLEQIEDKEVDALQYLSNLLVHIILPGLVVKKSKVSSDSKSICNDKVAIEKGSVFNRPEKKDPIKEFDEAWNKLSKVDLEKETKKKRSKIAAKSKEILPDSWVESEQGKKTLNALLRRTGPSTIKMIALSYVVPQGLAEKILDLEPELHMIPIGMKLMDNIDELIEK